MNSQARDDVPIPVRDRSDVMKDMLVFQLKLFTDGLKDILLSPLSLIAGLTGVLLGGKNPGALLYQLLRAGQRFEDWIGLFSAAWPKQSADSAEAESALKVKDDQRDAHPEISAGDFDALVDRMQASLLDPETRNRLSERSKQQLEAIAKRLRRDGV